MSALAYFDLKSVLRRQNWDFFHAHVSQVFLLVSAYIDIKDTTDHTFKHIAYNINIVVIA